MKLSLVIPTYNEKENIQKLLRLLREHFDRHAIDGEIIVVDDNSPDGTGQILEELRNIYPILTVVHRSGKLGLSSAVMEGFKVSSGDIVGVMDADLSHPVEEIKNMINQFAEKDADLVIGSRYIKGGSIKGWNVYRKMMSRCATLLARFFASAKDPMSGFFLIRRECVSHEEINPKGFKILLELLVKAKCKNVVEVPITFVNRTAGKSKAGMKEIIYYLRNLAGYLRFTRFGRLFLDKKFLHYTWIGIFISVLNIFLLWVMIDNLHIPTVISSTTVVVGTFILRYVLFDSFRIL